MAGVAHEVWLAQLQFPNPGRARKSGSKSLAQTLAVFLGASWEKRKVESEGRGVCVWQGGQTMGSQGSVWDCRNRSPEEAVPLSLDPIMSPVCFTLPPAQKGEWENERSELVKFAVPFAQLEVWNTHQLRGTRTATTGLPHPPQQPPAIGSHNKCCTGTKVMSVPNLWASQVRRFGEYMYQSPPSTKLKDIWALTGQDKREEEGKR